PGKLDDLLGIAVVAIEPSRSPDGLHADALPGELRGAPVEALGAIDGDQEVPLRSAPEHAGGAAEPSRVEVVALVDEDRVVAVGLGELVESAEERGDDPALVVVEGFPRTPIQPCFLVGPAVEVPDLDPTTRGVGPQRGIQGG